jgi:S-DNA-T family DNA segregation ATPase FtsK/SpoIIIE
VDDVHLYAVSGGSLASLESLPHCGAHVTWEDLPRLARLVDRLDEEVARRRRLLTTSGHPGMTQWWAADVTAPPPMVLLVDDLDQLVQRTDAHQHGALTERLLGLLGSGSAAGLVAVLAGDRSLLAGRAASSLATRVVLRLADPTLAVLAGLPSSALGRELPAGRGVLADGTEVQLALPSPRGEVPARAARHRPVRVEPLPSVVHESDLPSSAGLGTTVWVGVGGDDAVAQGLDPAVDGRRWLVCGSAGSGLTSTLLVLARQLSCAGHHVAVVASESSSREWQGATVDVPGLECFAPSDVDSLTASREAHRDLAVVVDDADELVDTPLESVLSEVAARGDRDGGLMVLGCDPATLGTRFRGLVCDLARHRTGIVLGTAGSGTNTVLGVAVDRRPGPPGRGFVVRRGAATAVQVALPSALAVPPVR